jgi:hypothetical protein
MRPKQDIVYLPSSGDFESIKQIETQDNSDTQNNLTPQRKVSETNNAINTLVGTSSSPIIDILRRGRENSQGAAALKDGIFVAKCNLPIRELMFKYAGRNFITQDEVEKIFVLLQMYSGETDEAQYNSFKTNLYNYFGNVDLEDVDALYNIFKTGRTSIDMTSIHDQIVNLNTVIKSIAPEDCKALVYKKQVEALFLWYQNEKEKVDNGVKKQNLHDIKRKLPVVFERLFNFRPKETGRIYLALSSSSNSFVHEAFKDSLIFGHDLDLAECWKLNSPEGLEKLKSHYKTALDFLIYLNRFNDLNPKDIEKESYQLGLARLLAQYPEAGGVLIPNHVAYNGSVLESNSQVEIFSESIDINLLAYDIVETDISNEFLVNKLWENLKYVISNNFKKYETRINTHLENLFTSFLSDAMQIRSENIAVHMNTLRPHVQYLVSSLVQGDMNQFRDGLTDLKASFSKFELAPNSYSRPQAVPSTFRERSVGETLEILKLMQKGLLVIESTPIGNQLRFNNSSDFPAPADLKQWNTVILSKFILELMYLDNSFLGRYNYYNLNKLRDQFIKDYTTEWSYKGQNFAFRLSQNTPQMAILDCDLQIDGERESIPVKMYIPAIKDKISLIRKIISKGVALNKVLDLMRIRIEVPQSLLGNKELRNKVFASLTSFIMTRQGNTLFEEPKDTHDMFENVHNQFSNSNWSMFKVVMRQNGEVSDQNSDKIREIADGSLETVFYMSKSFTELIQKESSDILENAKLINGSGIDESIATNLLNSLKTQSQFRIDKYMQAQEYIYKVHKSLTEISETSQNGQAVDSTFEVQMIAGPALDDHNLYEWKQVLSILKLKLPFYERALKLSLNLLLFTDLENCGDVMRPLYIWTMKTVFQAILDVEIRNVLMNDEQFDTRILAAFVAKIVENENERSHLDELLTDESWTQMNLLYDELSDFDLDNSMY